MIPDTSDYFEYPIYLEDLADIIEGEIKERNRDCWPVTRKQIARVAAAHSYLVDYIPRCISPAVVDDHTICVQDKGGSRVMFPRVIHELSEAIGRSRQFPEYQGPPDSMLAHRVARVVEERYKLFYFFVCAARRAESEFKRQRRARPLLVELRREPVED